MPDPMTTTTPARQSATPNLALENENSVERHRSPPKISVFERAVRLVLAAPVALAGAFALFTSAMLAQHGAREIAPFVGIPAFGLLFSAYGIVAARSEGWLAFSLVIGILLIVAAMWAVKLFGAL